MAYNYEKVNKKLLVPQIEDRLMIYIDHEGIAIGSKLPSEYKLAELFGVGRSTIREEVKSLVAKGILEVRRGSGTFVKSTKLSVDDPLGLAQFEDKYQLAVNYGAAHGALAMTTSGDTTMATLKEVEAIMGGAGARVQR